jgi:DNA-binding MarR family transcriptional regulator
MNNDRENSQDDLRSFLLMSELESNEPISQREIAGRLNIALGLVNSYLKNLAAKGYVTVKAMPRNRYAYLLTPTGFAEKSRLAFQHLGNFNKLYQFARQDSHSLFARLREEGISRVSFCGVDELTEIFFLSLQEAGIELETVMDTRNNSEPFFNRRVVQLPEGIKASGSPIVLTSLQRSEELKQALLNLGVIDAKILGPALSYESILRRNGTRQNRL